MMKQVHRIDWHDSTEAFPAFLTIIAMPLTFSIANGIALGMIVFPFLKLLAGRIREVHWVNWILAIAFIAYFLKGA